MFSGQTNTPTTAKKKHLVNITADQLNSNQQVIPVTWFAGRRYISAQYLSPCYNQETKDIQGQTGKDTSDTVAHTYFADFGLLWAVCGRRRPVDAIFKIILDSVIKWRNDAGIYRDTPPYVDITPGKLGTLRFYWGTGDQGIDPLVFTTRGVIPIDPDFKKSDPSTWPPDGTPGNPNPLAGHYDRHSAYKFQAYSVQNKWKLGRDKEQVPQFIMELGRGVPWFVDSVQNAPPVPGVSDNRAYYGLDFDARGVNPIGAIYELVTDDMFGLGRTLGALSGGFTDAELRQAGWEAALTHFRDLRISPFLTEQSDAKSLLTQLLEYVDGYLRDYDGQLDIGFWDHGPIDIGPLPILTDDDLDGEAEVVPGNFADTDATTWFSYTDKDHHYNDRPVKRDDPAIRRLGGNSVPQLEDRKFFTDQATVKKYAAEWYASKKQIPQSGSIPVKREWLDNHNVREGDRFLWQSGKYGLQEVLRLNEIEWPEDRSGQAKLEVEYERAGSTAQQYVPPAILTGGEFEIEPVEITNKRIVELPSGLKTSGAIQVAVLAQRPRVEILGFSVYVSVDNTTFDPAQARNNMCAFGKIAGTAYPDTTADLDTVTGITVDLFGVDQDTIVIDQTDSQRDDNNLLLFVDNEIMSVGRVVALGAGRFNIKLKRALYGSLKAAHFIDANCWFILRDKLIPIANRNFNQGATRYFKLLPYTIDGMLELTDVSSFAYNFINTPAVASVFNLALSTDFGVAADNTPDIRIFATWDFLDDQDIFLFEVDSQKLGDAEWQSATTAANKFDFEATPATVYLVKVRPINSYGEPGLFTDPVQIRSAKLAPFRVTGLEMSRQANDTIFQSRDAKFEWRWNSPSTDLGAGAGPIGAGNSDPLFLTFEVTIWNGNVQVWRELVVDPQFVFTFEKNRQAGGPFPTFRIEVRAFDVLGEITLPETLTVTNPVPGAATNAQVIATPTGANIQWMEPLDIDLAYAEILMSTDPFDPSAAVVGTAAAGTTSFVYNNTAGLTGVLYFWIVEVDTFDNSSAATFAGSTIPGVAAGNIVISPAGGTISGPTQVLLSCPSTPTAQIYWRNDGTPPATTDNLYDPANPPVVSATGDFSAVGYLNGGYGNASTVHFALDLGACASPTFNPVGGTYSNSTGTLAVAIATSTAGAQMRYTLDGSAPSAINGTPINGISGTVTLPTGTRTIKAIAFKSGLTDSSVATADYTVIQDSGPPPPPPAQVADPSFSPAPGTYNEYPATHYDISVQTTTPLAQMRYTLDGSTPTPSTGTPIAGSSGIISLPAGGVTIKVIAFKSGFSNSNVLSGDFTIVSDGGTVASPTFYPPWSGNYANADGVLYVSIATATAGAQIHYTLDGSVPTPATGTPIASGDLVAISGTKTLKAIAFKSGMADSAVASTDYNVSSTGQVATPVFTPPEGDYNVYPGNSLAVQIASATPGAIIRYTTNGTTPTSGSSGNGTVYSGAIILAVGGLRTIKAIAYKTGLSDSVVKSGVYTVDRDPGG